MHGTVRPGARSGRRSRATRPTARRSTADVDDATAFAALFRAIYLTTMPAWRDQPRVTGRG